jgi:hypothetical protein
VGRVSGTDGAHAPSLLEFLHFAGICSGILKRFS